jgi:hypothetical protein
MFQPLAMMGLYPSPRGLFLGSSPDVGIILALPALGCTPMIWLAGMAERLRRVVSRPRWIGRAVWVPQRNLRRLKPVTGSDRTIRASEPVDTNALSRCQPSQPSQNIKHLGWFDDEDCGYPCHMYQTLGQPEQARPFDRLGIETHTYQADGSYQPGRPDGMRSVRPFAALTPGHGRARWPRTVRPGGSHAVGRL